jgi:ribosomal protein L37AE/L43A
MRYGDTQANRREKAKKHARYEHVCPRCGRRMFGNGYGNHKKACRGLTGAQA